MDHPNEIHIFVAWKRGDEVELTRLLEGMAPLEIFKLGVNFATSEICH